MYSDEELERLTPKIRIDYLNKYFLIDNRKLSDPIPEDAYAAYITTSFPFVNAKGEFVIFNKMYRIYVGKLINFNNLHKQINNLSENDPIAIFTNDIIQQQIKTYQEKGIRNMVITERGLKPLEENDAVVSTHEEMANAVAKIIQTFNSVSFSVQNQKLPTKHR